MVSSVAEDGRGPLACHFLVGGFSASRECFIFLDLLERRVLVSRLVCFYFLRVELTEPVNTSTRLRNQFCTILKIISSFLNFWVRDVELGALAHGAAPQPCSVLY